MATKRAQTKVPNEIPLEPFYYSFLLDSIPDRKHRSCVKAALDKYNSTCMKAYKELLKELERCKKAREAEAAKK